MIRYISDASINLNKKNLKNACLPWIKHGECILIFNFFFSSLG